MPDFAFRAGDDDTLLAHHGEARRLQRHLRKAGHDAHVESNNGEHRVFINHPRYSDTGAYANKADPEGNRPHWIRK